MSNMSYCRFHNTLQDLRDCEDNLFNDDLSEEEHEARKDLVELCKYIVEQCYSIEDDELKENSEDIFDDFSENECKNCGENIDKDEEFCCQDCEHSYNGDVQCEECDGWFDEDDVNDDFICKACVDKKEVKE